MRILIADDDEVILALLETELGRRGFKTFKASDGAEAWALLLRVMPNLAILDGNMPGMSGFEVLEKIRNTPSTKKIPVIMLTARNQKKDIETGLSVGIIDYIIKPFEIDLLVERIREVEKKAKRGIVSLSKKASPPPPAPPKPQAPKATKQEPEKESLRILLVEKFPANQKLVKPALEKHGHTVDLSENEDEALKMASANPYHLLLIDSDDPHLDGYGLCNTIRLNEKKTGGYNTIIGLGNEAKSESKRWLVSGMDDYLSKPVHIRDLMAIVRKHEEAAREKKV